MCETVGLLATATDEVCRVDVMGHKGACRVIRNCAARVAALVGKRMSGWRKIPSLRTNLKAR